MDSLYLGLLMALGAIWGASFLFIKIGVAETGAATFSMLRVLIGALVLWIIIRVKKERLPRDRKTWLKLAFMGLFNALIPYTAIGWGTKYTTSGLSAILNATLPLFTFVLACGLGSEKLSVKRVLGLLIGFGGIVVLTLPKLQSGATASIWGEAAIIAGTVAYAIASNFARAQLKDTSPIVASFGQVFTGLILLIPFSLAEQPWTMRPSVDAWLSIIAIGTLGTGLAYIIYYRLLKALGATGASLVTYIVPIFGVFWGWLILGEQLDSLALVALALIFAGMPLVNRRSAAPIAIHTPEPQTVRD